MVEKIAMTQIVAPVSMPGKAGGTGGGQTGVFSDMVRAFADRTVDSSLSSEKLTLEAVDKDAELVDIVTAVANAEVTLSTVVTIRDRVIQAYQEIIRMPI